MQDFKKLIELIDKAVTDFNQKIPAIQQQMLDRIRIELNSLELKNGNIAISTKNVRKIAEIKSKLQSIMLNADYIQSVKDFVKSFQVITDLQNQYFNTVVDDFTVPVVAKELRNEALKKALKPMSLAVLMICSGRV